MLIVLNSFSNKKNPQKQLKLIKIYLLEWLKDFWRFSSTEFVYKLILEYLTVMLHDLKDPPKDKC